MSSPGGRANLIVKQLCDHPEKFDFFQAVRILADRKIKFKSAMDFSFPAVAIKKITEKFVIIISFFGLIGAGGALPYHYTELLIKHKQNKNNVLRDFLDIFHHRAISNYYNVWKKYRLWMNYQQFDWIFTALAGSDFLPAKCYAGLMRQPRSAIILQQILSDYFSLLVKIIQFQPELVLLLPQDCSRLSSDEQKMNALGVDVILGNKVYIAHSKVRICLINLTYKQFQQLLPIGEMLQPLCQMVNFYLPAALHYDIKLDLRPEQIPPCQLQQNHLLLGWNTWLGACSCFNNDNFLILKSSEPKI